MTARFTALVSRPLVWNAGYMHLALPSLEEEKLNTHNLNAFLRVENPVVIQSGVRYVGELAPSFISSATDSWIRVISPASKHGAMPLWGAMRRSVAEGGEGHGEEGGKNHFRDIKMEEKS